MIFLKKNFHLSLLLFHSNSQRPYIERDRSGGGGERNERGQGGNKLF